MAQTIEEKQEAFASQNRKTRRNKELQELHGLKPVKKDVLQEIKSLTEKS